jgi:HEAT repeat protein
MAGGKWAEVLRGSNAKARRRAAFTLGNIGPSDPVAVPALINALKDADAGVRREAILALLKTGAAAQEAVSLLRVMQKRDRDAQVRAYATKALDKLQADK